MTAYYDTGNYTRKISTTSGEAQRWFDHGLIWAYGFHFEESVRCFKKAIKADPNCPMAYWGIAYAAGPNYNRQWQALDAVELSRVLNETEVAAKKALSLRGAATAVECALIEAIVKRHPSNQQPADFMTWTNAYADAMRTAYQAHSNDDDVCALFADAVMSRTPWKLWNLNTGEPMPGASTQEARDVLESAIKRRARANETPHAGLLHYYIHVMEMSPIPEVALRAGDELRNLCPDIGHLSHMPTHIDFQCGHYHNVVVRNSEAIAADRKVLAREGPLNFHSYSRIHNIHFKLYGAMFLGQYNTAMEAIREFEETVPEDIIRMESPPMADILEGYYGLKQHAWIRFGRWQEIIDEPLPHDPDLYLVTTALCHYAKAVAHAALGEVDAAERGAQYFSESLARVPVTRTLFNNTCVDILAVASAMMHGEIEYSKGHYEDSFDHLRHAIYLEDNLPYDEPWGWMQPVRHALGALSLEQNRVDEALAVYRADLGFDKTVIRARHHPENVWSLHGVHECLQRKGKVAEADLIEPRLKLALARSDVSIKSSCFCRRGRAA